MHTRCSTDIEGYSASLTGTRGTHISDLSSGCIVAQEQAEPCGHSASRIDLADMRTPREDLRAGSDGATTSGDHRAGGGGAVPAEVGPRVDQSGRGGQDGGFGLGGESALEQSDYHRVDHVRRISRLAKESRLALS